MNKIAVLGGGNGAFITAADLSLKGFNVNLFEIQELSESIYLAQKNGGIKLDVKGNLKNVQSGNAKLNKITSNIKDAIIDRDIIFLVVPAFAQKIFAKLSAEFLKPEQIIILEPGNFGGSLEFAYILKKAGVKNLPFLVEFECMLYSGFKNDSGSVWVSGYKDKLKVATYPGKHINKIFSRLIDIYPGLEKTDSILETGLSNTNSTLHAPILILNSGWVENKDKDFLFYWEGCTQSVAKVAEKIDLERIIIGKELGINLVSTKDIILNWYKHQGAKGNTLYEVLSTNPVYEWDYAPNSLEHRFILEDVPYGMVPMEILGKILNVNTPLITSIIEICSTLVNKDLREHARDFRKFMGNEINKEKLLELVYK